MDRASELFERLQADGLAALKRILDEEEPESLFLDYKKSATRQEDRALARSDRENLSKALSGFANSEGGLLIWGVDARRKPNGQREVLEKAALPDAIAFRTLIEGAISGVTIPALSGVRVLHILEEGAGTGFVIVHVPKSLIGPIRSVATDKYHLRSGSSFGSVPHGVLAGMFGQSPQPVIKHNLIAHSAQLNERRDQVSIAFAVSAGNFGAVLAADCFLLEIWLNWVRCILQSRSTPCTPLCMKCGEGYFRHLVSSPRRVLSLHLVVSTIYVMLVVTIAPAQLKPFKITFTLGARGAAPEMFSVGFSADVLQGLVQRLAIGRTSTADIWEVHPS
ncbi:AlbA family DNA-binding domain-containing protein [Pseudoxanthomonas mexicana]